MTRTPPLEGMALPRRPGVAAVVGSRSSTYHRLLAGLRRIDPFGLAGVALLLGLWFLLTLWVPKSLLPPPETTFKALVNQFFFARKFQYYGLQDHGYWSALLYTLQNIAIAMAVGCTVGILAGLVTARNSLVRAILDPVTVTLGTVPVVIAAPFLILWFGLGRTPAVAMVAFSIAIILYVYAQRAVDNLEGVYEASARTFGASRGSLLFEVLVPGTLPEILGGIRIALAGSWGLEAIGELMGSQRGLGKLIESITTSSDTPSLFAALIILGLTALILDALVAFAIARVTRWRAPSRNAA